jgi:hypothetical protein
MLKQSKIVTITSLLGLENCSVCHFRAALYWLISVLDKGVLLHWEKLQKCQKLLLLQTKNSL